MPRISAIREDHIRCILSNSLIKLNVRQTGIILVEDVPDPEQTILDRCDLDLGGSGPMPWASASPLGSLPS
jgi:hypothetical protein